MKVSKKKIKSDIKKFNSNIKDFSFAPLEELEAALNHLNTEDVKPARNLCRNSKKGIGNVEHLTNIHYCNLIKHSIMKHEWKNVLKLLLAYIDEPRSDRHTSGILYKYTFIYLLNDPVARKLDIMDEFLQLALSCHTHEQKTEFLNVATNLINNGKK